MILITLISACAAGLGWILWRAHSNARLDRWLKKAKAALRQQGAQERAQSGGAVR